MKAASSEGFSLYVTAMEGYESNSACILDYLTLFQALAAEEPDKVKCCALWNEIVCREEKTGQDIPLAPLQLRRKFRLNVRDFLLVMSALALELDGGLRNAFRQRFALQLPSIEYGLQLIEPIYPSSVETFAQLAGRTALCGLLLAPSEPTAYPLERPLILCRGVLSFLTGFSLADCSGITVLDHGYASTLPLHTDAEVRIRNWFSNGGSVPLSLLGPTGSGRRTTLCRACGRVVCVEPGKKGSCSPLEQELRLREAVLAAFFLSAPVCTLADSEQDQISGLETMCRRFGIPFVRLGKEGKTPVGTGETVRLPRQLSPAQRETAWRAFAPHTRPDAVPEGAMTVGRLRETALLASCRAAAAGRTDITAEDTRYALRQGDGAAELGLRSDKAISLDDMVLPGNVVEQLELICRTAQSGGALAKWGIPGCREGVTAVFHGPSGTGKTMAASVIASRLGVPLLRANLSQIMDKYVGETEKHLERLLQSARENHCVLLFDEADALFGKRAAVSAGHDKYANLSTSFLLQEMEQYDGVALLSTNLLGSFDDAFLRRLHYIVRFPLPDAPLRERLWRRVLPAQRLEGEIPFALLARVELSPARIGSVARNAAVCAVSEGRERLDIRDILKALCLELEKSGKKLPQELFSFTK